MQDRRARRAGRGLRPAGPGAHRSRRHERRRGPLQGLQEARLEADRGLRDLLRGRPPGGHPDADGAQPPDAAGVLGRGLPQPRQALLGRLPGRAAAGQADRRSRPARAPPRGRDRAHRLPGLALLPAAARGPRRRRPRARAGADRDPRRGERVLRGAEERTGRPGEVQRGDRADRPRARREPRRHRRRPLPAPRGLRPPHGPAVRADEEHDPGAEAALRDQRVLPARQRGDGWRPSRSGRRRSRAPSRSPNAARSSSSSASS